MGCGMHAAGGGGGDPVSNGEVTVWEGSVGAGELIFIPESWAHEVRNEDATVAISYNFVN